MVRNLVQLITPASGADGNANTYQLLDIYSAFRRLIALRSGVDEIKAEIFRSHAPAVYFEGKQYESELHHIEYDHVFEDTVGHYDLAVDAGSYYRVVTYRFEIVDGEFVECSRTQPVHMLKSAFHHRRRKRSV